MPRGVPREDPRTLFACREPFARFVGGVPEVYSAGRHVLGDDPILLTHRQFFVEAAELVTAQSQPATYPRPVDVNPNLEHEVEVSDG
jgi:hypothetical protein